MKGYKNKGEHRDLNIDDIGICTCISKLTQTQKEKLEGENQLV